MDGSWDVGGVVCHLQCDISSVEVTGIGGGGGGRGLFFLRCHVPAGGGRTIQIDSRGAEAAAEDDERRSVSWRDVASLRCDGSPACVRELADRRSVAFEVRRRRKIMGRAVGSELVGRAEVPWRDVVGAATAAVERRVALAAPARAAGAGGGRRTVAGRDDDDDDAAAPVMSVRMSVRVSEMAAPARRRSIEMECAAAAHRETCGCEWIASSEDVFGMVTCGVADDAFE